MVAPITVWTKPVCVQCNAVKRRLVEQLTHQAGLSPEMIKHDWEKLKALGWVQDFDLTADQHVKDLEHFKGLGYTAAPITEWEGSAIPGYNPDEIDKLVEKWKTARASDTARV